MDGIPNPYGRPDLAPERVHRVTLELSGQVRARLRRFMNRQEFVGMRPTEIIAVLLDREEVHPDNIHSYAVKRRRDRSPHYHSHNDPHQSQMSVYDYENMQIAGPGRSGVSYVRDQEPDEDFMEEYGDEFGDEEDIMEQEQIMMLDNEAQAPAAGTRTGKLDRRNQMSHRLEYYSTHDKIMGGMKSDLLVNRLRSRKTFNAKLHYRPVPGQRQWTSTLRRHWYGLVARWKRNELLHCRLCGTCMEVSVRGVGLRAGNAFDHVCKHFGKPVFVCRICSHQTITSVEMRDHIRAEHQADTRTFVDFLDANHGELEQMITYCFEPNQESSNPTIGSSSAAETVTKGDRQERAKRKKYRQGRSIDFSTGNYQSLAAYASYTARQFCYQMIIKWQRNNALYCRQCDQWLRVGAKNNWLRSETAMQHICGHLGKPLYRCRSCPQTMATSRQIRQHLQTAHQSGIRGRYTDLTETYQEELKQVAAACFDWMDAEGGPPLDGGKFLRPKLRQDLENNVGRREALALCRRLIQACAENSKMHCVICNTNFVATTKNGYPLAETVYNHSLKHLDPAPYVCRVCSKRTHNSANMRSHIWSKHKQVSLTEFDDYTADYENDIITILSRCFIQTECAAEGTDVVEQGVDSGDMVLVNQREVVMEAPIYVKRVINTPEGLVLVGSNAQGAVIGDSTYGEPETAASSKDA